MIKKLFFRFLPLFLIIFFVLLLFGKNLFPPEGKIIAGGDIIDAYYYWKNYLGQNLKQGIIPFWNPYNFSGTPFLAHPNINIFYPPQWLFILLPLNISFSVYFFIHVVFAGISMYWLARKYTDRFGALFSALTFCLSGFFAARIYAGHLEYVDAASFVPLVFGLLIQVIDHSLQKNIVKAALAVFLMLCCGNELFFLFTLEMVFLYLFFRIVRKSKERIRLFTVLPYLFLTIMLGFGLAACQILPRYEFLRLSLRSQGVPYQIAGTGALPLEGWKLFISPFLWGKPFLPNYSYHGPWPNLFEYTHYVGILPIILVLGFLIFYIFTKLTRKIKIAALPDIFWFFLFLVIPLFFLISFGGNLPFNLHQFLWQHTPFYKSIRFPARHLFVVAFSLSFLVGIVLGKLKYQLVNIILFFILVTDLLLFGRQFIQQTDEPVKSIDRKLLAFLQKDSGSLWRFLPDFSVVSAVRKDLDFGAASVYRIPSTSDYNSMILWPYYKFIDLSNGATFSSIGQYNVEVPPLLPSSQNLDFLNVKYLLVDKNQNYLGAKPMDKFKLVSEGERYKLFENSPPSPRIFLVNFAVLFPSQKQLEQALLSRKYDLTKTVLLLQNEIRNNNIELQCDKKNPGIIKVLHYAINEIELEITNECNSFLSTSEVYYPGWSATIDGVKTQIYKSNLAFRAMYLPEGEHRVRIFYQPQIYFMGSFISIITLVGTVIIWKHKKT